MSSYILHPAVYGDLVEIHAYIEKFNADAADRIPDEFLAAFDLLAKFPDHGHLRPDLTARPMRFKVMRTYLIAYAYELRPLWIVAVIDGRRNPRVLAAILRARN